MIYDHFFSAALARPHEERRYRVFADLERIAGVSRTQYGICRTAAPGRDLVLERPPRHGPASQGDRRNGRNRHPNGCWRRWGESRAGR